MGASEYRQTAVLRGRITAIDYKKRTFTLSRITGDAVQGFFTADLGQRMHEYLNPDKATKVAVRGLVVYDPTDRPRKIEKVAHIDQLDPNNVPARLEEFTTLKEGWLDGAGSVPGAAGIEWLIEAWQANYPDDLPLPFAYPTEEGGVRFEWTIGKWEVSADMNLPDRTVELFGSKMGEELDVDITLNLAEAGGWAGLAESIAQLVTQVGGERQ